MGPLAAQGAPLLSNLALRFRLLSFTRARAGLISGPRRPSRNRAKVPRLFPGAAAARNIEITASWRLRGRRSNLCSEPYSRLPRPPRCGRRPREALSPRAFLSSRDESSAGPGSAGALGTDALLLIRDVWPRIKWGVLYGLSRNYCSTRYVKRNRE